MGPPLAQALNDATVGTASIIQATQQALRLMSQVGQKPPIIIQ